MPIERLIVAVDLPNQVTYIGYGSAKTISEYVVVPTRDLLSEVGSSYDEKALSFLNSLKRTKRSSSVSLDSVSVAVHRLGIEEEV